MKEVKLREAFSRIKEDIIILGKEISQIREQLLESNSLMKQINEDLIKLKLEKIAENNKKTPEISVEKNSTHLLKTSTHPVTSTQTSTHPQEIGGLKTPNLPISIGNQGVSTDRQTNRQIDQQIFRHIISRNFQEKKPKTTTLDTTNILTTPQTPEIVVPKEQTEKPIQQQISEASDLLDSLDAIKKEIRRKFKAVTRQEMLVFSTIYQLEEQKQEPDYKKIALKLGLSQSSIRDYVQRIIIKGIPITKEKLNNKQIILHISPELKKIATLDTIIKLRGL